MEADLETLSSPEIRRRLRQLPMQRRKEIGRAIREGRAVNDPRDAPLAAAWAERLGRERRTWPWWVMPRHRPKGWRAWAWLLHLAWMIGAVAYACVEVWPNVWHALPGVWRWLIVGLLIYGLVSLPVILWFILRLHWNAPQAARRNRDLSVPD